MSITIRTKELELAIDKLYRRFRIKPPFGEELMKEVFLASQDFRSVPDDSIDFLYENAYLKHEGQKLPTHKQMLNYYREVKQIVHSIKDRCEICNDTGYITIIMNNNPMLTSVVRCHCSHGQEKASYIKKFDDSFTVFDAYKHNKEIAEILRQRNKSAPIDEVKGT